MRNTFEDIVSRGFNPPENKAPDSNMEADMKSRVQIEAGLAEIRAEYEDAVKALRPLESQLKYDLSVARTERVGFKLSDKVDQSSFFKKKIESLRARWNEELLRLEAVNMRVGMPKPEMRLPSDDEIKSAEIDE